MPKPFRFKHLRKLSSMTQQKGHFAAAKSPLVKSW